MWIASTRIFVGIFGDVGGGLKSEALGLLGWRLLRFGCVGEARFNPLQIGAFNGSLQEFFKFSSEQVGFNPLQIGAFNGSDRKSVV